MVAGIELVRHATGHEMLNNQSEKLSLHTEQNWIVFTKLVATYNFAASLFCTAQSLFRTILDPARSSSPKVVILAQPPLL